MNRRRFLASTAAAGMSAVGGAAFGKGQGPATTTPPQGNDAKCGFACHTVVKARDYVFTEYGKR